MPSINIVKKYRPNSTYHIYNRGAFKTPIYRDKQDYEFFYTLLWQEQKHVGVRINVESLMENHLHLQIFQKNPRDMQKFMTSLTIRYALYFRKKYDHSGRIFQGTYKASLLKGIKRIKENTIYILDNPKEAGIDSWPYVGRFSAWRENFL